MLNNINKSVATQKEGIAGKIKINVVNIFSINLPFWEAKNTPNGILKLYAKKIEMILKKMLQGSFSASINDIFCCDKMERPKSPRRIPLEVSPSPNNHL